MIGFEIEKRAVEQELLDVKTQLAANELSALDIDAIVEDMYKLAMPPGEEIIHVIPQEYIVDNEQGIKNPIGMSGNRLEANCHSMI